MEIRQRFKISSALKDIIGRDLITNDFVAIFELVKNSFDAHATHVDVIFDAGRIWVVDDGKGLATVSEGAGQTLHLSTVP